MLNNNKKTLKRYGSDKKRKLKISQFSKFSQKFHKEYQGTVTDYRECLSGHCVVGRGSQNIVFDWENKKQRIWFNFAILFK